MTKITNYIFSNHLQISAILLALYLINPFYLGFLIGYLLILKVLLDKNALLSYLDRPLLFLFLFCVIYACFYSFNPDKGSQYIFLYALLPGAFYLVGKSFVRQSDNKIKSKILIGLGIIFSAITIISVLLHIVQKGFVQLNRNVPIIWDGAEIPATNMASYLLLNMCIPAILLVTYKRWSKASNLFLLIVYVLSIICVVRLGNRTQLGITLITLIAGVIYLFSKQSMVKNIALFIFLFIVTGIGFKYVTIDKDADFMTSYADRIDNRKYGTMSAGGRTEKWQKALSKMVEDPLGWKLEETGYIHNFYLDVLRVAGIIPFFMLVMIVINFALRIKRLISKNSDDLVFNLIILVYLVAFLLIFFVEPIFEGYFEVFILFCFFMGFVNRYAELNSTASSNNLTD